VVLDPFARKGANAGEKVRERGEYNGGIGEEKSPHPELKEGIRLFRGGDSFLYHWSGAEKEGEVRGRNPCSEGFYCEVFDQKRLRRKKSIPQSSLIGSTSLGENAK